MLSLAMVVKDEVLTIERVIESVSGVVDEIVVGVDTESSDGTRKIVERLADKVIDVDLSRELREKGSVCGDEDWGFSKARNTVIEACDPENWKLILDGHEFVRNPDVLMGELEFAFGRFDGVTVSVHFEPDSYGIPVEIFESARVLGPSVRYKNPIHNVPVIGRMYYAKSVVVEHMKQKQDRSAKVARDVQRADSNIQAFMEKVSKDPADSRSWFYLATAYKESSMWPQAINAYSEYLKVSSWKEERCHARMRMGACLDRLGEFDSAHSQFALAIQEFPQMAEPYYYLGHLTHKLGRYHEAQVWLERCVQMEMPNCSLFLTPKIYKVDRYDKLSMVYHHLGHFGRAIKMAEKALESASIKRIYDNVEFWRGHIRRHGGEYYDQVWEGSCDPSDLEERRMGVMGKAVYQASRVLDVGCGPGHMMGHVCPASEYVGVDVSEHVRDIIQERGRECFVSLEDVPDYRFDACLLGEIVEHVEDDLEFVLSLRKKLKDGAVVVASVPRYCSMRDPAHTRDYTEGEFMELMGHLGKTEMLDPIGPWMISKTVIG